MQTDIHALSGFPVFKWAKTVHALDRAAMTIDGMSNYRALWPGLWSSFRSREILSQEIP
jgi:hypothetical protein